VPGLSSLPIHVADDPVKLSEVEGAIRTLVTKYGCELVVVDYLQLVDPEQESNENRELTLISRTLKQTFKRLNVAGIAACQLNRGNETNGVRKPAMRDLRGSGSLEQDGDLILLLHREDVYHQGDADYEKTDQLEVIVVKNKDGDSGTIPLWFSGKTQTITNWADRPGANPFSHITPPHVPRCTPTTKCKRGFPCKKKSRPPFSNSKTRTRNRQPPKYDAKRMTSPPAIGTSRGQRRRRS
jgi:hypothetical protein